MRSLVFFAILLGSARAMAVSPTAPLTAATCVSTSGTNVSSGNCSQYASIANTCATAAPLTGSTVYYFCDCQTHSDVNCVAGSDSNNGTAEATPWQTITKFVSEFSSVADNTTFRFCRGGAWTNSGIDTRIHNTNSTSSHGLRWMDYTSTVWTEAVDHMPIIDNAAGNVCFYFNQSSPVANGYYSVYNVECFGNGDETGSQGFRVGNAAHNIELCNTVIDYNTQGIQINGNSSYPNPCYTLPNGPDTCLYPSNLTVHGNYVLGNFTGGSFGSADNFIDNYNVYRGNGADGNLDHNWYRSGQNMSGTNIDTRPASGEQIIGNVAIDTGTLGTTCNGTQLDSHGYHRGEEVEDNVIIQTGANPSITGNCWGIDLVGASGETSEFIDLVVSGNWIINPGQDGIYVTTSVSGSIFNNFMQMINSGHSGSNRGISFGSGNDTTNGIMVSTMSVYSNTIVYAMTDPDEFGTEFQAPAGTGNVFDNNVTYFNSPSATGPMHCIEMDNGSKTLVGGSTSLGEQSIGTFQAISNGSMQITINGTSCTLSNVNFSGATTMGSGANTCVGQILQNAIQACGGNAATATVGWLPGSNGDCYTTSAWTINTGNSGSPTTITVATSTGSGTDISGTFGLTTGAGATVSNLMTSLNYNECYAVAGPAFNWEYHTGDSFSSWKSAFSSLSWDANSANSEPKFYSYPTGIITGSTLYPFVPLLNSPLVLAGTNTYAPSTDLFGAPRTNPPDLGAFQHPPVPVF
jgi:Protein of unknown function (DUF3383)